MFSKFKTLAYSFINFINGKVFMIKLTNETNQLRLSTENRQKKYYTKQEVIDRFAKSIFAAKEENQNIPDKWKSINNFRAFVSPSLNQGLSDVLKLYAKSNLPIIEIGAGIGYSINPQFPSPILQTQMNEGECQLLSNISSNPIYQLNIEKIADALKEDKKKISLFFGLNVFDAMPEKERENNLAKLSSLQTSGDQILILSDTNPTFGVIINDIEASHPGFHAIPFLPLSQESHKLSCVLVPKEIIPEKYSEDQLVDVLEKECLYLSQGYLSKSQIFLHHLQEQLNLKVIDLEDFYIKKTQSLLEEVGYTSIAYRHVSFITAPLSIKSPNVKQDLVYKAVSDTATVRQWALDDRKLKENLEQKNIPFPSIPVESLRENGEKVFGAELLIIVATKQ